MTTTLLWTQPRERTIKPRPKRARFKHRTNYEISSETIRLLSGRLTLRDVNVGERTRDSSMPL